MQTQSNHTFPAPSFLCTASQTVTDSNLAIFDCFCHDFDINVVKSSLECPKNSDVENRHITSRHRSAWCLFAGNDSWATSSTKSSYYRTRDHCCPYIQFSRLDASGHSRLCGFVSFAYDVRWRLTYLLLCWHQSWLTLDDKLDGVRHMSDDVAKRARISSSVHSVHVTDLDARWRHAHSLRWRHFLVVLAPRDERFWRGGGVAE